jgi:hypothetical protein
LSLHQVNINNKFILSVHFDHLRMFWACGGGCRREWRFFSLLVALWHGSFDAMHASKGNADVLV